MVKSIKVRDIMNRINKPDDIISVDISDTIKTAAEKIITSGLHRIIVTQNMMPNKILRLSDIHLDRLNEPIEHIFNQLDPVNKVSIDDDIEKISSAQDSQPVSIVYDKSEPVGIITPNDVIRYVKKHEDDYITD